MIHTWLRDSSAPIKRRTIQSSHTLCSGSAASRDCSVELRNSQPRRVSAHSSALQDSSASPGR
jgi:hypothetical protein